ncbi:glycine zipper 2TM domain-containing protein [Novosphingobium sp. NDB2Meth1]|uniref:glycine zipper 2TM domain-containing protein n=1 Tax=Novosphingobium sp. NDB2Meth1 TaxID=1892847 RepID=UPI000930EF80|nr:glycine zipper 2TM domain-containing protein [Novosphingobium sp. NDB2Meth1]
MARLFRALAVTALASSLAVPALAHETPAQVPVQSSWQTTYPGVFPGGYPVYGGPVYSVPVYSVPMAPPQGSVPPQGYVPAPQGYVPPQGYVAPPPPAADSDPRYREMIDKCQGVTNRHSGTTGAVIGGLVGGVVGNRVASGERTVGTVAGAAVGAVAGGVIGKSIDKKRERECEEFFSTYSPPQPAPGYYGYAAPAGGYAYGYPSYGYVPPMTGAPMGYVMVPSNAPQAVASAQGACTETRTVSYEYVPVKKRYIGAPPRRPVLRDKRVRVPMGS